MRFVAPRVPRLDALRLRRERGGHPLRPALRPAHEADRRPAAPGRPAAAGDPPGGAPRAEPRPDPARGPPAGTDACTVARRVADAWVAAFRSRENPRDNWSFGWRTPGGKILRISAPRLRVSSLVVPGRAGFLMCRESPDGTAQLAPLEVDCEVAAFRFRRPW